MPKMNPKVVLSLVSAFALLACEKDTSSNGPSTSDAGAADTGVSKLTQKQNECMVLCLPGLTKNLPNGCAAHDEACCKTRCTNDPADTSSGESAWDPHIITFDGTSYDNQRVGEFYFMVVEGGDAFQVRHVRLDADTSVIGALAITTGSSTISVYPGGPIVFINHAQTEVPDGSQRIGDDILMGRQSGWLTLLLLESQISIVIEAHSSWLNVFVTLPANLARTVDGQLGRMVNNQYRGLRGRTGAQEIASNAEVTADKLFAFIESWRIQSQAESRFEYRAGERFGGFDDATVATQYKRVSDMTVTERQRGEGPCRAISGLEGTPLFDFCVFDVAHGGDAFAAGYTNILLQPKKTLNVRP